TGPDPPGSPGLQSGLQLRPYLAPQCFAYPLARVPHLERGHVGVALGCRHPCVAKYLLNDSDVHPCSISRVAAVCRASWTLASRTPACLRIAFRDLQSLVRSIGPPCRVAKTRS